MRTERDAWSANGLFTLVLIVLLLYLIIINIKEAEIGFVIIFTMMTLILFLGLTIVKPNEAKAIVLFGKYLGTIRQEGLIYTVPFTKRKHMSLKVQSLYIPCTIQVADEPRDMQLILFYKIVDTAKVLYEVEQLEPFIRLQSKTILKLILLKNEPNSHALSKEFIEEITNELSISLQHKLSRLGLEIIDLYIVH